MVVPTAKQTEKCKRCVNAFLKCDDCVDFKYYKRARYMVVAVTRTRKYRVVVTGKYQWAVKTGRFEGSIEEYAAHMGEMNAPEAECIDTGYDGQVIKRIRL